ncbi:MAG: hypothetical protein ACRENX_10265 [Candidatus Dormibacteria bacterium]
MEPDLEGVVEVAESRYLVRVDGEHEAFAAATLPPGCTVAAPRCQSVPSAPKATSRRGDGR